jgi:predicted DNA-binding transcriptional regulator YafY
MDKNQFARYKKYDAIFRNFNVRRTKAELLLEMEVSEKTFNLDRRAMEELYPVEIEAKKGENGFYYQYLDKDMSIAEKPLSQDEVDKIEQAVAVLSGISGVPVFQDLEETLTNLRGFQSKRRVTEEMRPFVSFQINETSNADHFETFFNAIRDKKALNIHYRNFGKEDFNFEIHPHFLKFYNEMWYVFGYNPEKLSYNWVVPFDRIVSTSESKSQYKKNEKYNFGEDYFDDIVGVTKDPNQAVANIKIRVKPESVGFIMSKPLNAGQKRVTKSEDGHFYTSLKVIPNLELYNRLLMFGDNIEVIEPKDVRDRLKFIISEMSNNYSN